MPPGSCLRRPCCCLIIDDGLGEIWSMPLQNGVGVRSLCLHPLRKGLLMTIWPSVSGDEQCGH